MFEIIITYSFSRWNGRAMFRGHWGRLLRLRRHRILFKWHNLTLSLRAHYGNYWCRDHGHGHAFRGFWLALWGNLVLICPYSDHMIIWFRWFSRYILLIIFIKHWACHHCWTFFELGHFMHFKTHRLFFAIFRNHLIWRIGPFSLDTFFVMRTGRLFTFHSIMVTWFSGHKLSFGRLFLIEGFNLDLF